MREQLDQPIIAIDGGGTRCRIALASRHMRHMVEVGSANVSTDLGAATTEIRGGLLKLSEISGFSTENLFSLSAYCGLAGVTGKDVAEQVSKSLPLTRIRVEDDRRAALRGALGPANGAIAHCGTGSFLAIRTGTTTHLVGGWGGILGDEASAYWVGRRALAETLHVFDGLRPNSALTDSILSTHGSTAAIVAFAAEAPRADIAKLAMHVSAQAKTGDPIARGLLQDGAEYIADALTRMGWDASMSLCLTGGLGPVYRDFLTADMKAALIPPIGEPIDGAIALALEFSSEMRHECQ